MFWENLISLCNEKDVSPTTVVVSLNISRGSVTGWKKGSVPNDTTLKKIADYFGVTPEYLLQDNIATSSERNKKEQAVLEQYNELTDEEKEKAREYIKFLISQRK